MPESSPDRAAGVGSSGDAPEQFDLDEIDRQLLRLLLVDGRISQRRLSAEVNLSPPAVAERLARFQRAGVIENYTTTINWAALGYPLVAYISMSVASGASVGEIITQLRELNELESLSIISGNQGLLARFRLRNHGHLRSLLADSIWPIEEIGRVDTLISLGEVSPTCDEPPLARLLAD